MQTQESKLQEMNIDSILVVSNPRVDYGDIRGVFANTGETRRVLVVLRKRHVVQ